MEIWRDIEGYEGLYQISDLGKIKSLAKILPNGRWYNSTTRNTKEKRLSPKRDGGQYLYVSLYKDRKPKNFKIHRLVAIHFIPNPDNKKEVNHKDFDKENNTVSNLEWVSSMENTHHAIRGNRNNKYTLTMNDALKVREMYSLGRFTYAELADIFGVKAKQIRRIVKNQNWNF